MRPTIRAGEITYRHLVGRTTYEVTITTYTEASVVADRPYLGLCFGATRGNGRTPSTACPASMDRLTPAGQPHIGEFIGGDVRLNLYTGTCTPISGPGVYTLRGRRPQPQLAACIENIPGSVDVPFCITSLLIIDPQAGPNDSPILLLAPAIENACLGQRVGAQPSGLRPRWRLSEL